MIKLAELQDAYTENGFQVVVFIGNIRNRSENSLITHFQTG